MEPLQNGDRIIQWWTIKLADNSASFVRYFPRMIFTAGIDLSTFIQQSDSRTQLDVSPMLGTGEYITHSYLYLVRNDVVVDQLQSNDSPLSIIASGGPLPPNVAALSSFRPDPPRSRRVSRIYWPFINVDFMDSDAKLTAFGKGVIEAVAAKYLVTIDWGGSGFVVRLRAGFNGTFPSPGEVFATTETSPYFATQSRRLRGSKKASWNG